MSGAVFAAHRFDGRYAVAVPVLVRLEEGWLVVESVDRQPLDREPLASARVFEAYARAPRLVALRSGVTLEVADSDREFTAALERAGLRASWVVRLQGHWLAAVVAVAAVIALCAVAYVEGVPRATRWAAFALTPELEARMGRRLLELLDEHTFEPSRLSPERRERIAADFARAAAAAAPGTRYQLEFRRTSLGEINAFTLPGGIIILLDATAVFGAELEQGSVLGVLGHELGHVAHKHVTRSILQSLGIGAIGGLLWGDFSGTAASVPILLGQLSYSRSFEAEADAFAVEVLHRQRYSTRPLYRFFACLNERRESKLAKGIPQFLTSHPSTEQRMEWLEASDSDAVSGALDADCPSDENTAGTGGVIGAAGVGGSGGATAGAISPEQRTEADPL